MKTETTTWLFKTRIDNKFNGELDLFFRESFFGIGGVEVAIDASKFESEDALKEYFKKNLETERVQGYYWWFYADTKIGDDVYICRDETVLLAYGKITGKYIFNNTTRTEIIPAVRREDFAHTISVDWQTHPIKHIDLQKDTGYKWAHPIRKLSEIYKNNPEELAKIKREVLNLK